MSSLTLDGSTEGLKKINMPVGCRAAAGWARTDTSGTQTIWYAENFRVFGSVITFIIKIETVASGAVNKLIATVFSTVGPASISVTSSNTVPLNTWFHWGLRWDTSSANKLYVYADGVETASADTSGVTAGTAPRQGIGTTFAGGVYFSGQIANVAAWGSLVEQNNMILSHYGGRWPGTGGNFSASSMLIYSCELDHDYFCQFGERVFGAGAQIVWGNIQNPGFSLEDPNIYPIQGMLISDIP